MKTLKQELEVCTKLGVDPARIKISNSECQKIENQIKDHALKQLLNKKEPR
jgi:hypothetical protein